jgi:hypothetical protein
LRLLSHYDQNLPIRSRISSRLHDFSNRTAQQDLISKAAVLSPATAGACLTDSRVRCFSTLKELCISKEGSIMRKTSLTIAVLFLSLGVTPAFAQTPIPITHCQRITKSGTYTFKVTSPAGHTGYCIDVVAPNVTFETNSYGYVHCNGSDNGIKIESTADNFFMDIAGTGGAEINNCVIGLRILPNNIAAGIFVDGQLNVFGAPRCLSGIKIDSMSPVISVGTPVSGGIQGSCPGGSFLSIGGYVLFTGELAGD